MSEKTQLSQTSPQFAYLEYFLQLCLQSSTARVTAAYALSNPHLTIQYERRCKDILTLDTWIDPSQLAGVNTEEEIVRRGFQFDTTNPGMKVTVGSLKPSSKGLKERSLNLPQTNSKNTRKAYLCRLGVGRAFAADDSTVTTQRVPDGYDSLYINHKSDSKKDAGSKSADYHHEYYIANPAQILPQYMVIYDYDAVKEQRSRDKACCDNCEKAVASLYCQADHANLCNECDVMLHSANKLTSRHVRTPIGKGADVFGFCRNHSDKQIEFFCSQCHLPVCVYCKMVGHHSSGDAAKHKLVSVSEAFQSVMAESQMPDAILQARISAIHSQMSSINSRAKSVEKHASQIETQIEEIYCKALTELRINTKKKLDVLLGDECELKRELGEIRRLEDFLQYQQQGEATHFLFSWARHQHLRAELHDFKFFRDAIDVRLDMKCIGSINVVAEDSIKPVERSPGKGTYMTSTGNTVGVGLPNKLTRGGTAGRKTQRRTSDFFTETLGALDDIGSTQESQHRDHGEEEEEEEGAGACDEGDEYSDEDYSD